MNCPLCNKPVCGATGSQEDCDTCELAPAKLGNTGDSCYHRACQCETIDFTRALEAERMERQELGMELLSLWEEIEKWKSRAIADEYYEKGGPGF